MPTIFSHAVFATVTGKSFIEKSFSVWFWFLTAVCAMIPDADVVGFSFGVKYESMFGHRGFTHSIFFAFLFGGFTALLVHKFLKSELSFAKIFIFFSLATLTHPLLDMLTNGGLGVALFAPFSNERFFSPWRPIEVSPIGAGFFSSRGLDVILNEILWVWIPAILILIAAKIIRKPKKN